MFDEVDSSHMTQGSLTYFTLDRFGNPNSALALNGGWTQVPSGIYFDSPKFTLSVWVYPQQVGSYSRIIDFNNGPSAGDTIVFSLSDGTSLKPYFHILTGSNLCGGGISSMNLVLNEWQFLTVTFDGNNVRIYLNGQLTFDKIITCSPPIKQRTNCFIGKSSWAPDGYSWSLLDDLRIFNKSLTQEQILHLMNQNETSKKKNNLFLFIFKSLEFFCHLDCNLPLTTTASTPSMAISSN